MTILSVRDLVVLRGRRRVIERLTLDVAAGEIVGVVGPNGCGKSTLLMAIAGVLEPRDGWITIDGLSPWSRDGKRARRAIGYVPEGADPPGFLTGAELWALAAATRGVAPPDDALRAALGLDELAATRIDRMSLGQRRRACLGAALLGPPALLVLDEPDNGLDAARTDALVDLLRGHAGGAVIASHDAALLDRVSARRLALAEN
jgi:ABC-type multidrug transport system ATPase subunit